MNRRIVLLLVILGCLWITPSANAQTSSETITIPNRLSSTTTTNIHLIIDPDLTLDDGILTQVSQLNQKKILTGSAAFTNQNQMNITYKYLEHSAKNDFVAFLHQIEQSSGYTGHDFNETAFTIGKKYVFTNVTGRSYDANLAINYLSNHLWDGDRSSFTLFLFNLTQLDAGMNHWFTIKPKDLDTGEMQTSFFKGTHGLIHGKSVSAWGGFRNKPVHFLDFSSELWWGDFINTVYGKFGWSDSLLSQKLQDFNDTTTSSQWMGRYVSAFIQSSYDNYLSFNAPISDKYNIPSLVLYDWYDYNLSMTDSSWILSDSVINSTFSTAFNWLHFNTTTIWRNLTSFPELVTQLNAYRTEDPDGTGDLIELQSGLISYLENQFIPQVMNELFDNLGSGVTFPSLIFFFNHTTFTYGGIPIAGIGGTGYQIQGLTPGRYYGRDGTPNRGFSDVVLHEVGHSLGLPHPFSNFDMWPGDMGATLMGYYTSARDFAQEDVNALGTYHTLYYLNRAKYIQQNYVSTDPLMEQINNWIDQASKELKEWNYKRAIQFAKAAHCGYSEIFDYQVSFCDSFKPPIISTTTSTSTTAKFLDQPILSIFLLLPIILRRFQKIKTSTYDNN